MPQFMITACGLRQSDYSIAYESHPRGNIAQMPLFVWKCPESSTLCDYLEPDNEPECGAFPDRKRNNRKVEAILKMSLVRQSSRT